MFTAHCAVGAIVSFVCTTPPGLRAHLGPGVCPATPPPPGTAGPVAERNVTVIGKLITVGEQFLGVRSIPGPPIVPFRNEILP